MPKLRLFLYIYRGYQFFTSLILSFAHLSAKHVSQPPQIPLSGFSLGLTRFLHVYVPKISSSILPSGCSQNGKGKWNFLKLFNHVEKSYMKKNLCWSRATSLLFATTKQNKALITVLLQTTKHSEYRVRVCAVYVFVILHDSRVELFVSVFIILLFHWDINEMQDPT